MFDAWWFGGLVVPILITVVFGGSVSVWVGVCVARLVAFDQARMAAVNVVLEMPGLANAVTRDQYERAHLALANRLLQIAPQFLALRQKNAYGMVRYLVTRFNQRPWADPHEKDFPLQNDEQMKLLKRLSPIGHVMSKMLFDLEPEWLPLAAIRRRLHSGEDLGLVYTAQFSELEARIQEQVEAEEKRARSENSSS